MHMHLYYAYTHFAAAGGQEAKLYSEYLLWRWKQEVVLIQWDKWLGLWSY